MKPDVSKDYYGLLGCQPNASDDEIKKAFRKQALLHHPDRNPGREEEAKSKFQDMQAAYDTLSTPTKRTRYDQERLKQGMLWQKRPAPAPAQPSRPQPGFFRQPQPQARPPPRPAPSSRYAEYAQPSRDESPYGADVNAKFKAFKAFEHMKGNHKQPSPTKESTPKRRPHPTAQKARSRGDWDEDQFDDTPRMPRSQSTRMPRKPGFNPYAEEGDDTSSRNTSAFYNVSRGEKPQASFPRPAENVFSQAHASHNVGSRSPGFGPPSDDAYLNERSTPYASHSGEKTYFSSAGLNRSASTATNLHNLNAQRTRDSPGLGSGRFRSASPRARSPRPDSRDDTSSSSSEDETSADRRKQSQQSYYTRRGSADPRGHGPKVTVQDESEEPPTFSMPKRQQTWDSENFANAGRTHYFPSPVGTGGSPAFGPSNGAQNSGRPNLRRDSTVPQSSPVTDAFNAGKTANTGTTKKPSLYDQNFFSFAQDSPGVESSEPATRKSPGASRKASQPWPYWAIPSSVFVSSSQNTLNKTGGDGSFKSPNRLRSDHANLYAMNSSFSIPSSSSGTNSPFKSPSTETVNTQFSPSGWHGQFFGAPDQPDAQQASGTRSTLRPRGSPPKRPAARPMQTSPPATSYGSGPTATGVGKDAASSERVNLGPVPQNPSPAQFSSDEWNKHFSPGVWMKPPAPPTRPIATPRSRNAKRSNEPKQSSGSGDRANTFVIPDDTGDEGDDEGQQPSSNLAPEPGLSHAASNSAMDIDNTPPASRVPSNVTTNSRPASSATDTMSPPPSTTFPRPPPPTTAFNMQPLNSAFPISGSSSAGLSDLRSDLGSTLPFESAAATSTTVTQKPQRLNLPNPPKKPLLPGRLTQGSCVTYMNQVATYMREFHNFNQRMLEHFQARQAQMEELTKRNAAQAEKGFVPMVNGLAGGGTGGSGVGGLGGANLGEAAAWSWMGARGDEGYMKYTTWMKEDERVRLHHSIAWEKHQEALEELGEARGNMKDMLDRGMLA